ncbi:MAG: peptide chain release factor N(5)-glutamine methyltransferase [Methylotenera sp.]|nr:peptide chain release factor N(5)-glutamine methyltransferase [Methylotenera sp.]
MATSLTVNAALSLAAAKLNSADGAMEARLLLQEVLGVNRAWLIAHANDALQANRDAEFQALLARRLAGEPIAYITAYREFYGLNLRVSPATLIPRADSETLVEAALEKLASRTKETPRVLDLGTGSGAIALAIAQHRPKALVCAVDASAPALAIAQENAARLNLGHVQFILSDWYASLANQRFDIIVSNPPYIAENDSHLSQGDLRFEPMSALASGPDGLDDIRSIIQQGLFHLMPQGWLMLEHGYQQAAAVRDLMANAGMVDVVTKQDLAGNDRVTLGKNPLIVSQHWD